MLGKLIQSALQGFGARRRDSRENEVAALLERAKLLHGDRRNGDAMGIYRELLRKHPKHAAVLLACGDLQSELNRHDEALRCFELAVSLSPRKAEPLFKLGNLYWLMGRLTDAEDCFNQILEIAPGHPHALNNLGLVRQEEGDLVRAEQYYRAALESDPNYADARSNLLLCLNYQDGCSPEDAYREHAFWAETFIRNLSPRAISYPAGAHKRIRVGYISPNLMTHSVAYFFEPLLSRHDSSNFEIFCYDDANKPDAVTARLQALSEHWRVVAGKSDDAVERTIRLDEIDILVELAGHTADHRLRLLARRVAPVQVTYLGYPNTTGIPAIDYRITDHVADPQGMTDSFYCETLARLPSAWCYMPPHDAPPVVERLRHTIGVTFGSFNKLAKLSDRAVGVWSHVLHAVPESSLLLKCSALNDAGVADRMKQRFVRYGVPEERIRIAAFAKTNHEHMALYGQVDIALDTFPYCGTTTTCEALYMGVPVVTLAGSSHAGRVGASLLSALGHEEWVASNEDQFVAIARELAQDLPRLAQVRKGLRDEMRSSVLMDDLEFTRGLESLYRQIHTGP